MTGIALLRTKPSGTLAWNRSLMLLTNTVLGVRQVYGSRNALLWIVTPKPGPDVLGSPSVWYLAAPMALRRLAKDRA
jgi:hypothetical protein